MKRAPFAFLFVFSLSPAFADDPSDAVKLFGALPQAQDVHLSPDGNHLAFKSGAEGREKFVIADITGNNAVEVPRGGEEVPGAISIESNWIAWKNSDHLLAGEAVCAESNELDRVRKSVSFIVDNGPDGRVMPIHLEKIWGHLLPIQFRDRILSFMPDDPDHVLIEARAQNDIFPDVMKVDLRSGISETVMREHVSVTSWMADSKGVVRLSVAYPERDLHRVVSVRDKANGSWRVIRDDQMGKDPAFIPLAFSRQDPAILYVGVEEQGHLAIRDYDTRMMKLGAALAADPSSDAVPVLRAGDLIGYRQGDGPVVYLDAGWQQTADAVRSAMPEAEIELVDRSDDGRRALVLVADGSLPPSYYLLDKRADGTHLDELGMNWERRFLGHTAPVQSVRYQGLDGSSIPAYITLPQGPRSGPIPFVVLLHDGPPGHDKAGYDYLVQFLASKGYGVFQPQFRGSTAPTAILGTGLRVNGVRADRGRDAAPVAAGGPHGGMIAQRPPSGKAIQGVFSGTSFAAAQDLADAFAVQTDATSNYEQASLHGGPLVRPGPHEESIMDADYVGLANGTWTLYSRAGYGEWGRSIQDDIVDGVHWLVDQGYADPHRMCVAGSGFGGYSALLEARDSSLFRCAAALAPMTDLVRLNTDARPFLNANYRRGYLGANGDELEAISPVAQADDIDVPVLLVHGREDCDVPVGQSEEMESALRRTREKVGSVKISNVRTKEDAKPDNTPAPPRPGRSVTALYLDSADHTLSREADRMAYLSALESFLGANLAPPR